MYLKDFAKWILTTVFGISLSLRVMSGQEQSLPIKFLETTPIIDGYPDERINDFEWQAFSYVQKTSEENNNFRVRYKIAYGFNFLYLIIESESNSIIYRDRAYQNGDGFHLVIAKPSGENKADEFYVLKFSPADSIRQVPAQKGVWYYNIDLSGKSLSSSTQFVCRSANGKCYFELLLPWQDVYPFNPFFSEGIGMNLCFVKAIGEKEKNFYYIKYDPGNQNENSKREYVSAIFEPPISYNRSCSFAMLEQNNIRYGNTVRVKTVSFTNKYCKNLFMFSVKSADNYSLLDQPREVVLSKGINRNQFDLPVDKLLPDGYKVVWKSSDNSEGELPLSIMPEINLKQELNTLNDQKNKVSSGDYYSLLFMIQNLVKDYEKTKNYETAGAIRYRYSDYQKNIDGLLKNINPFQGKKGIFRRAFLSSIDSTLQPYTVNIPANFDRTKKYPLFVMLHGSGSDDQNMLNYHLTEGNFIEMAPFGRGTSNCFTTDHAEIDVREAINDVISNYPIDTGRIIIAGFSMGGYGAYRLFYQYPKLFKGVAVFSGDPSLATKWLGEGFPDFLDDKYLNSFRNIPIFIYHSKNDINCPYDLTLKLVDKLKKAGTSVEFITTENMGHGIINKENLPAFYKWLNIITAK